MAFYFELQRQLQIHEAAVDCERCQIDLKCCTYRPFFANFLLGYASSLNLLPPDWEKEWDMLVVGATPNKQYRQKFKKIGGWGFGTESQLLCTFFSTQSRSCKVWLARPGVCRAFYCKSSYAEKGSLYWKKFEDFIWHLEWCLLEDFLFTKGFVEEDITLLKNYLSEGSQNKVGEGVLGEFRLSSWEVARKFYEEAWGFVSAVQEERVREIIGPFGTNLWAEMLAEKQKLP